MITTYRRILHLLNPGLGVKRWVLSGTIGVGFCSIGVAYLLRKFFAVSFPDFLPWYFEGFLLVGIGGGAILFALHGLYRTLASLTMPAQSIGSVADTLYDRWSRGRGPKIVAIGGGTGLSVLLDGLRRYTENLTAIVTVADDGGSSGRLRRDMDLLPPGDFRNCLVAMSDSDSLLAELFQYRFSEGNGLKGHSFGNLFIAAMSDITGNFDDALLESSRVLAVRGRVVPSTTVGLELSARFTDGSVVRGESKITKHAGEIERLMIAPESAQAHPRAIEAIRQADLVVIGPGSLYTSVLPNLMIRGMSEAVTGSNAVVVYLCNVATEVGETAGYTVADHLAALQRHTRVDIADYVMANANPVGFGTRFDGEPVVHDGKPLKHAEIHLADLVDEARPIRHHSAKLADAVMAVHESGSRRPASVV